MLTCNSSCMISDDFVIQIITSSHETVLVEMSTYQCLSAHIQNYAQGTFYLVPENFVKLQYGPVGEVFKQVSQTFHLSLTGLSCKCH